MTDLNEKNEALLASILQDVTDPVLHQQLERRFRRDLVARQKRSEENREAFDDAYAQAVALGMDDPLANAQLAVKLRQQQRIAERIAKKARKAPRNEAARYADKRARAAEKASRTANPGQRRKPQQDRLYVEILGTAEKAGRLGDAHLVGAEIQRRIPRYRPEGWDKAGMALKVLGLSLETHRLGGRTINLRVSEEVHRKAMASPRGPVSYLQNRVRDALKRALADDAPEFWFALELDSSRRLHLHGAYVHEPHIDQVPIDDALARAGRWKPPLGKGQAQLSKPLTEPFGWADYVTKHANLMAMETDRKLLAMTAGLRAMVISRWPDIRASLPRCPSTVRKSKS